MNVLIGQQSNWDPQADEEARRRIREQEGQKQQRQDKQNPDEEDAARKRIEEQRRQEKERNQR